MTTSALTASIEAAPQSRLPFTGLLRAELRRLLMRRFILILLLGYLLVTVIFLVFQFTQSRPYDAGVAERAYATALADCKRFSDPSMPMPFDPPGAGPGLTGPEAVAAMCADQLGPSAAVHAVRYGIFRSYYAATELPMGVMGGAVTFAAIAGLIGATAIGAEWAARTLPGLLTWEPRRVRVLLTKLLALGLVIAPAAALVQALQIGGGALIAQSRGTFVDTGGDFWPTLYWQAGRGVLLALLFLAAGYALTATFRYTAAAVGIGFAYLIFESVSTYPEKWWTQWKLSTNVGAWLSRDGGYEYTYNPRGEEYAFGMPAMPGYETVTVNISNGRAGLYLLALTLVLLAAAVVSFRRRDIS